MTKYWYYITSWYCPLCGKTKEYRERRYTPRPTEWKDRHRYEEHFDWCDY